ncbi:hypothetical protein [Streptomyces flavovirens]|uniref:hypothetical protein n=1 Tax=Streptomyces flavovirens TaxID=52258 RepID=UPI0031ED8095
MVVANDEESRSGQTGLTKSIDLVWGKGLLLARPRCEALFFTLDGSWIRFIEDPQAPDQPAGQWNSEPILISHRDLDF